MKPVTSCGFLEELDEVVEADELDVEQRPAGQAEVERRERRDARRRPRRARRPGCRTTSGTSYFMRLRLAGPAGRRRPAAASRSARWLSSSVTPSSSGCRRRGRPWPRACRPSADRLRAIYQPSRPSCWACFFTSSSYCAAPSSAAVMPEPTATSDLLEVRSLDRARGTRARVRSCPSSKYVWMSLISAGHVVAAACTR